ncbi:UNVERIFIED_CONTAM: hypothetical protein GTU68_043118 [Idotea baltica]|nr:hypothetical protein [Idotea baltica]
MLIEVEGKKTVFKRFQIAPREHTKLILPMLEEVLDQANLTLENVDAIAFGRGPGAFTGLRIATGIAQGLALSVDKPTIPVSSLSAMALAAKKEIISDEANHSIVVAIDARMGEVYWAEFMIADGQIELLGDEQLSKPEVMFKKTQELATQKTVTVIGSGWDEYIRAFEECVTNEVTSSLTHLTQKFPAAEEICELALIAYEKGEQFSVEDSQPVYLRNNVAEKSKKK